MCSRDCHQYLGTNINSQIYRNTKSAQVLLPLGDVNVYVIWKHGLCRATQEPDLEIDIEIKHHVCQSASLTNRPHQLYKQKTACFVVRGEQMVIRWHNGLNEAKVTPSQYFHLKFWPLSLFVEKGISLTLYFSATVSWINGYSSPVPALEF